MDDDVGAALDHSEDGPKISLRYVTMAEDPDLKPVACANSVIVTTLAVLLSCALAASTSSASSSSQSGSVQAEFEALITRVKQSDPSVDFLHLRRLYAESSGYSPFSDDAEESMIAAAQRGQYETALRIAREILARNYVDIEAHFAAAVSCRALNDSECAGHHAYVARGMIDSILASGDGKGPQTAFVVVKTPEEYALLRVLQVRRRKQALIRGIDGRAYDELTVEDSRTGEELRIYFNVDIALAGTRRTFGLQ